MSSRHRMKCFYLLVFVLSLCVMQAKVVSADQTKAIPVNVVLADVVPSVVVTEDVVTAGSAALRTITMVGSDGAKASFHGRWLLLIYTEVFRRLGYAFEYKGYPAARASAISDAGQADGEIHRVPSYGDKHPELILVDEPHFMISFSAYSTNPAIKLDGWQSLSGTKLNVGHRLGIKKTETLLPAIVQPDYLQTAISVRQGIRQVMFKRTDIYIDVKANIEEVLMLDEFNEVLLHNVGVMEEVPGHSFLHKKNKSLVLKVATTLKEMKKTGLIEKYRNMVQK